MPRISVILPVYNVDRYLEKCMDSILNQTFDDFELICIDDGSTDTSLSILKEYANKDLRITIIIQKNQGAGVARNKGIDIAKGKYLSFLDADDYIEATMLQKMYEQCEQHNAQIGICKAYFYDNVTSEVKPCTFSVRSHEIPDKECFSCEEIKSSPFHALMGWAWDKLYLKEFVIEYKLRFQEQRTTNDMYFVFMSLLYAKRISIIDEYLYYQRRNVSNSLSSTRYKSWECFYYALIKIKEEMEDKELYSKYEQSFSNYALHSCLWNLESLPMDIAEKLYNKLINEWFDKLNINGHDDNYFENKNEYKKYLEIINRNDNPNLEFSVYKENQKHNTKPFVRCNETDKNAVPKVSVILPIYNTEEYLYEAMESVVNQTLKEIEIICVNDGSTDNSLNIIKEYSSNDSRIKVIDGPNGGYGKAMNKGLNAATGEYIGILEPDDYVSLDMFEKLYDCAKANALDFVKADFYRFKTDEDGSKHLNYNRICKLNNDIYNKVVNTSEDLSTFLFIMNTWSGIYSRSFLENNKIRHNETPGASYQDNGFWFQTFCLAERSMFIDVPLYRNRRDNPNSSMSNPKKVYCTIEEYNFIRSFLEKHDILEKYKEIYEVKKWHNCVGTLSRISSIYKYEYVLNISNIFKNDLEELNIQGKYFTEVEWHELRELVYNPEKFYQRKYAKEINQKKIEELERQKEHLNNELLKVQNSISYRVGLKLTAPMRFLVHLFRGDLKSR